MRGLFKFHLWLVLQGGLCFLCSIWYLKKEEWVQAHQARLRQARPVSIAVLSCRRPDLLNQTIRSLEMHVTKHLVRDRWIVDCDNATVPLNVARRLGYKSIGAAPRGPREHNIMDNIQVLFQACQTPIVLFTEDDWLFTKPLFLEDAMAVLNTGARVSQVRLTGLKTVLQPDKTRGKQHTKGVHRGVDWYYSRNPAGPGGIFGAWSNNPCVFHRETVRVLGGDFSRFAHELQANRPFREEGYSEAQLIPSYVTHIGTKRHVTITTKVKTFSHIVSLPASQPV